MRIDSKALVASISSLADAQPQHDLAATLQQVVDAAKLLFGAKRWFHNGRSLRAQISAQPR